MSKLSTVFFQSYKMIFVHYVFWYWTEQILSLLRWESKNYLQNRDRQDRVKPWSCSKWRLCGWRVQKSGRHESICWKTESLPRILLWKYGWKLESMPCIFKRHGHRQKNWQVSRANLKRYSKGIKVMTQTTINSCHNYGSSCGLFNKHKSNEYTIQININHFLLIKFRTMHRDFIWSKNKEVQTRCSIVTDVIDI